MNNLLIQDAWSEIELHLTNQTKNKEVIQALNFFLKLGLGLEDMANATELSLLDKFQGMVSVYLAINEVALEVEKYEICILIRKAFFKQNNIMVKLLNQLPIEEELWGLEFTKEYFYQTLQLQANKEKNGK